ncbi:Ig-like domain-containing protein [Leptospira alexanderi]|uniref:Ig-like protein n=1 Tax=Leptospira alexanderi serovar Manhao 3 str. L 60 TaxID=1049759 RepID=V6HZH0_9LEPT|nr:Ig-like domain-containing protein [Leptospira alexanderi]EQA62432.1 Ig-like protein [Leptospira alexanderi serovar Manhao 3 str. L 60]
MKTNIQASLFLKPILTKTRNTLFFVFTVFFQLLGCGKIDNDLKKFSPFFGESDRPKVLFSNPGAGEQNLPTSQSITIGFSKTMNMNSCQLAFSISPQTQGFFNSANTNLLTFTPSAAFKPGTYTFSVSKSCEDTEGKDLEDPFSASIAIGTSTTNIGTNPTVNSMYVLSGNVNNCNAGTATLTDFLNANVIDACMGNPSRSQIVINFSRPMSSGATQSVISTTPLIQANYTWNSPNVLTITPDYPLIAGQRYSVLVGAQATDQGGAPLASAAIGSFFVGSNNAALGINSINILTGTSAVCKAGVGVVADLLTTNVTNACLGNPTTNTIVFNFTNAMDRNSTQAAITFSPQIPGSYTWAPGNQVLTYTTDQSLIYGVRYGATVGTSALTSNLVALRSPILGSFVAGSVNLTPHVQAFGLVSQGCAAALPGTGNAIGGNWLLGSCWWDDTLPILTPSSYQFRGGDDGTAAASACVNRNTDDFKIIFSNYMDPVSTASATNLTRVSPPLTSIRLASWNWSDCQGVFPFGCRVLSLQFSEMESTCGGVLAFGATGDFNLSNASLTGSSPTYTLQVGVSATDTNGKQLSAPFSFSFISQ